MTTACIMVAAVGIVSFVLGAALLRSALSPPAAYLGFLLLVVSAIAAFSTALTFAAIVLESAR